MRKIFVTGIGTDVGKTFIAAILTEALKADYWKPVQTGSFFTTDSTTIEKLISNTKSKIHEEAYCLKQYMSPHAAAEIEGCALRLDDIQLPETENTLIIEGAGGLMVPINDEEFIIDMIKKFDAETVLVIQNYLGSINHSLLSIDAAKAKGLKILGIVFNGRPEEQSERIILSYSGLKCLGHVKNENKIDKETVLKYAQAFENLGA